MAMERSAPECQSGLLASSMAKDFPEVEYAVASRNEGTGIVSYGDSTVPRSRIIRQNMRGPDAARQRGFFQGYFLILSWKVISTMRFPIHPAQ